MSCIVWKTCLLWKRNRRYLFIAGGSAVYQEFLPFCTILYRTVIHHVFDGDAYFPPVDWSDWSLINTSQGEMDEKIVIRINLKRISVMRIL